MSKVAGFLRVLSVLALCLAMAVALSSASHAKGGAPVATTKSAESPVKATSKKSRKRQSSGESAERTSPDDYDPELARVLRERRAVVYWLIGGGSSNAARRNIGWGVAERGWMDFKDRYVMPYVEMGAERFQLHNPFGSLNTEHMQMDQYLEAREAAYSPVDNGYDREALKRVVNEHEFIRAFKPLTDQGIEITCYVGSPRLDPDFLRIEREKGEKEAFSHAFDALEPCLRAGMSIGLDAASPADGDSSTFRFAELLKKRHKIRVYTEARPAIQQENWADYPFVSANNVWDHLNTHNLPNRHPQTYITHPNLDYHHGDEFRVMMLQRMGDGTINAEIEQARRIQGEHENVTLAIHGFHAFDEGRMSRVEYLREIYADYLHNSRDVPMVRDNTQERGSVAGSVQSRASKKRVSSSR